MHQSLWAGVSGQVEEGETSLQGAVREIMEETGVPENRFRLLTRGKPINVGNADGRRMVSPFVFALQQREKIRLDFEHTSKQWIRPWQLHKFRSVPKLAETLIHGGLPADALRAIDALREDREHGAMDLAHLAVQKLADLADDWTGLPDEEFDRRIELTTFALSRSRPSMAAVQHALYAVFHNLNAQKPYDAAHIRHVVENLQNEWNRAQKQVVEHTAKLVRLQRCILTHSWSDTVIEALRKGLRRDATLYVTEARPLCEGKRLAAALKNCCRVVLITDAQAMAVMPEVDMVLVGADAVTQDGAVINKSGTALLGLAARNTKTPMYAAAQWLKLHVGKEPLEIEEMSATELGALPRGVAARNIYFDRTPPECLTGLITEDGELSRRQTAAAIGKRRTQYEFLTT